MPRSPAFKPTEEMIIFISDSLRENNSNTAIANAVGVKPWNMNNFLNKSDHPLLIKAKQERLNVRAGRQRGDPRTTAGREEARGLETFGKTLTDVSWGNRLWMQENGYGLSPKKKYDERDRRGKRRR